MTKKTASEQIQALKEKLDLWNYEYYVLDNPSVSDAIYDKTMQELISLENEFPELRTNDSPSCRVGGFVSEKFIKIKHLRPMMSLSNAFNDNDLIKFDSDIREIINKDSDYILEPKIDGLSISLIYENAKLVRALTRGDGVYGEDVTANIFTIKSIPIYLDKKYKDLVIEVRGEVYMDKSDFLALNQSLDANTKPFANPRNAAAGTLRNLDSSVAKQRNLKALFYYVPGYKELGLKTHQETINWLKENKFSVSDKIYLVHNVNQIISTIEEFAKFRENLDYQIDGVVIKTNEYQYYDEIGYTSKFPKWAIAYKFPATVGLTQVKDIIADVGRTGKITYVAVLKPISLDGSVISKVTLNNAEYIKLKDVRIHDWVYVYKSGDVIPYLDYVELAKRDHKKSKEFIELQFCPSCHSELVRFENEVDQKCINKNCEAQLVKAIDYFCSRDCMDIKGISLSIIQKLYDNKIIQTIPDLYKLEEKKETVLNLDLKIKNKNFTNLVNSINASKTNSCEKLLTGLGIKHLGKTTAKKIAIKFKNLDALKDVTLEELLNIEDVGEILGREIFNFFHHLDNLKLLEELKTLGLNFDYKVDLEGFENFKVVEEYKQKTFVITGTFSIPRNEIKNILENLYNAKVVESVSKKVDYLLAGETPGSKVKKANDLNIKIISNEFWKE